MKRVHWKLAFEIICYISVKKKLVCNLKQFVYHIFMNWNNISFFLIFGKNTCSKWDFKNQCSGWAIESAQILIILTEILSWPCALLTSKVLISLLTSLLPKQRVLIRSFVIYDVFAARHYCLESVNIVLQKET